MGMVAVGQPFPFWVKGQTALHLKASSAVPADLVRLQPGCEVAVAPRPRDRGGAGGRGLSGFPVPPPVQGETAGGCPGVSSSDEEEAELPPATWLRVQVSGGRHAGVSKTHSLLVQSSRAPLNPSRFLHAAEITAQSKTIQRRIQLAKRRGRTDG